MTNKTMAFGLALFALSLGFCVGAVLWRAKIDEDHYGQLFQMLVAPPPAVVAPPASPPKRWGI